MKPPTIISAQAVDDRTLLVKFSNLEVKKYDISPLLDKPMFASLQNPSFFKSFNVDLGGYGLTWNDAIDISEYELWQHGVSLTGDESDRLDALVNDRAANLYSHVSSSVDQ